MTPTGQVRGKHRRGSRLIRQRWQSAVDFGALEVQAVYISGTVREPFEYYMEDPKARGQMDCPDQPNYPRPDYLSSSRKRLAPQLLFTRRHPPLWRRKCAVASNKSFYDTLPRLTEAPKGKAEHVRLIYDLRLATVDGQQRCKLTKIDEVFTELEPVFPSITTPVPGKMTSSPGCYRNGSTNNLRLRPPTRPSKSHSEDDAQTIVSVSRVVSGARYTKTGECCIHSTTKPVQGIRRRRGLFQRSGPDAPLPPKPKVLVEPFAGGGIITLTALFEKLVGRAVMVELDEDVAAVWITVVEGNAKWLQKRILARSHRESVIAEISICYDVKERAFQTILKNRTFHGGILTLKVPVS